MPFTAVKVFFDPSVPYGLQFEETEATSEASPREGAAPSAVESTTSEATDAAPAQIPRPAEKKPRAVRKPRLEKSAEEQADTPQPKPAKRPAANTDSGATPSEANVVSLDKFRKK